MSDLISRQVAIDAFYDRADDDGYVCYSAEDMEGIIRTFPSAQPEIIRCKDCKFWQDQEEGVVEVPICARPQNRFERFPMVMIINGDGFCSYGKRRTDG